MVFKFLFQLGHLGFCVGYVDTSLLCFSYSVLEDFVSVVIVYTLEVFLYLIAESFLVELGHPCAHIGDVDSCFLCLS